MKLLFSHYLNMRTKYVDWPVCVLNARILIIGSPSGCVRSEISGMTQVDEKGREGNSSSHSLYMLEETWSGIYLS